MKRRVGKYKDKIIVEGDKNEFKSHEVSINELAGTDNGEGGGIQIEYYKVNNVDEKDLITNLIMISPTIINAVSGESYTRMSQQYIGSNGGILSTNNRHVILGFAFINVTSIIKYLDGPAFTLEGTLQERADYLTTINGEDKINIYDYIEPITEEEFYNLKYEK